MLHAFRRLATGNGDQPGFLGAIELTDVFAGRRPPIQGRLQTLGDVLLADPRNGGLADLDRLGDHLVGPARPTRSLVGFQQDARVGQLAGCLRARGNEALQQVAFGVGQCDRISFVHAPRIPATRPTRKITCHRALVVFPPSLVPI